MAGTLRRRADDEKQNGILDTNISTGLRHTFEAEADVLLSQLEPDTRLRLLFDGGVRSDSVATLGVFDIAVPIALDETLPVPAGYLDDAGRYVTYGSDDPVYFRLNNNTTVTADWSREANVLEVTQPASGAHAVVRCQPSVTALILSHGADMSVAGAATGDVCVVGSTCPGLPIRTVAPTTRAYHGPGTIYKFGPRREPATWPSATSTSGQPMSSNHATVLEEDE
jgi:hypothetical protein